MGKELDNIIEKLEADYEKYKKNNLGMPYEAGILAAIEIVKSEKLSCPDANKPL